MGRSPSSPRPLGVQPKSLLAAGLLSSVAWGCSVATEEYSSNEASGSTHAVIQIQRAESLGGTHRGDALAGFVRLPASTDRTSALSLAGLHQDRPAFGQCRLRESAGERGEARSLGELTRIELLDAERVELLTPSGTHELAPHAFPSVTDWIRGVVYTSRDRAADQLPAGVTYRVLASKIEGLGSVDTTEESPKIPSEVTVDGLPWEEVSALRASTFLDVTWAPTSSDSNDAVTVVLETRGRQWTCAFSDAEGAGSVPLTLEDGSSLASPGTDALLSVHRIRHVTKQGPPGIQLLEVRFDFSVVTPISFE